MVKEKRCPTPEQHTQDLANELSANCGYEIRDTEIGNILYQSRTEFIMAPFIERKENVVPGRATLHEMMHPQTHDVRYDKIHCMVHKKAQFDGQRRRPEETGSEVIGISVEYLKQRLGICLVQGDVAHMADEIQRTQLAGEQRQLLLQHISKTPAQRFSDRTVDAAALTRSFFDRLAECDITRRPMVRAICEVVGNGTFRLHPHNLDDEPVPEKFLTAYPTPSFYVRMPGGEKPIFVNCTPFRQLLTIRRSPDPANRMVRRNLARANGLALAQIGAAMDYKNPETSDSPLLRSIQSFADAYQFDADYVSASARFVDLGGPMDAYFTGIVAQYFKDDRSVPWFYSPLFNKLAVHIATTTHGERMLKTYPRDQIEDEAAHIIEVMDQLKRGEGALITNIAFGPDGDHYARKAAPVTNAENGREQLLRSFRQTRVRSLELSSDNDESGEEEELVWDEDR